MKVHMGHHRSPARASRRSQGLKRWPLVEALEGRELLTAPFVEYPTITMPSNPNGITAGPDGNLWFAEISANRIGRITTATSALGQVVGEGIVTEFVLPTTTGNSGPAYITTGPDGNLWFTEVLENQIGRLDALAGSDAAIQASIVEFDIPTAGSQPVGLTAADDGNVWFTEQAGNRIARITPTGVITEFTLPGTFTGPNTITDDAFGNIWYGDNGGNALGRINPLAGSDAAIQASNTEFALISPNAQPISIIDGPDNRVWFTQFSDNSIGVIDPAAGSNAAIQASLTEFPLPPGSQPHQIAVGPDNALYFAEFGTHMLGRITPSGLITECPLPLGSGPVGLATGSDGDLWITAFITHEIINLDIQVSSVQFSSPTYTVDETGGFATITITRTGTATGGETITFSTTAGGTATAGADFTTTTQTVTFAANQSSVDVQVPILDDVLQEGPETVFLALTNPQGTTLGTPSTAVLTIVDNEDCPPNDAFAVTTANELIRFNTGNPSVIESTTPITGLQGGDTILGLDFRPANGVLYALGSGGRIYTIDTTTAVATLVSTLAADPADATSPFVTLSGASFGVDFNPVPDRLRVVSDANQNLRINVDTGLVITDGDLNPGDPTVVGSAYTNSFVPSPRTSPPALGTTLYGIDVGTDSLVIQNPPNNGTLAVVGTGLGVGDVTEVSGFDIGGPDNHALASLTVGGVTSVYRINLTTGVATLQGQVGAGGALRGFALAQGGVLQFSTPTVTVVEGQAFATLTVTRTLGSDGPASATIRTVSGTAVAGQDFVETMTTVTFADGDTTPQTVTIPILDDANFEFLPDETFTVVLSDPSGCTVIGAQATATVSIVDNEPRSLTINDVTVNESAGTATFTVSLNAASNQAITVNFSTGNGTATAGLDFTTTNGTLTFAPGVISQTITVPILADTLDEPDETFVVNLALTSPNTALLADPQGVGTIVDDDLGSFTTAVGLNVTATVGTPLLNVPVASFTDANAGPASSYHALVNFGDGTAATLALVQPDGAGGFRVISGHTFASAGVFNGSVTVFDADGTETTVPFTATAFAPALTCLPLTAVQDGRLVNVVVATMGPGGGPSPIANFYDATIDWGDGTAPTTGFVEVSPAGVIQVVGSHTFVRSGPTTIRVQIGAEGNPNVVTAFCAVNVADLAINLTGQLDPTSDTGLSNADKVTNDNTPTFFGTSQPGSIVTLTANGVVVGSGVTDAAGNWRITTVLLADGAYTIVATAVDPADNTTATLQILPMGAMGQLIVDTVGPKVTGLIFDRLNGRIGLGLVDDRTGLDQFSVIDGSNYAFSGREFHRPQRNFLITSVTPDAVASPTAVQNVTLTINGGRRINGGTFRFLARSGGLRDVAGNALDGEFFGFFPSGNNLVGGDFVAILDAVHHIIFSPAPEASFATPITGGVPGPSFRIRPGQGLTERGRNQVAASRKRLARPVVPRTTRTTLRNLPNATKGVARN